MKVNIYLYFPGSCEEAFTFYQSVLGGEILAMHRFAGSPGEGMVPKEWGDKIMHVDMEVAGVHLMGSDLAPDHFVKPQGYNVSLQIEEPEEAERAFAALSEGGQVTMALEQTFWARRFGILTDRFGINWMVNCE